LTNLSDVRCGWAGERVDAVQQCLPWVVGLNPSPVGVSDFVVEPDERAPGCPSGEGLRRPVQLALGLIVVGNSTTASFGRPSRGATTSFASAIQVVAQTIWPY
jgi:hypothetical protein